MFVFRILLHGKEYGNIKFRCDNTRGKLSHHFSSITSTLWENYQRQEYTYLKSSKSYVVLSGIK